MVWAVLILPSHQGFPCKAQGSPGKGQQEKAAGPSISCTNAGFMVNFKGVCKPAQRYSQAGQDNGAHVCESAGAVPEGRL